MPLTAHTLRWIDRDERHQARVRAGLRQPRPIRDLRISYWGGVFRYAASVKPVGTSVPEGVVVLAVRRDEHDQVHAALIEAYEGDNGAFSPFPRLAYMLGATELQIFGHGETMLYRILAVDRLADNARFDRATLLSRPLLIAGRFDRSAIMATACAVAKGRRSLTGESWTTCRSAALKGVWKMAKTARLAAAH